MIDSKEYARVVESFLMEMEAICGSASEADLRQYPGFAEQLQESLAILRDPASSPESILATAFSLVDQFTQDAWPAVIQESYALYTDLSGGKSNRHPDLHRHSVDR